MDDLSIICPESLREELLTFDPRHESVIACPDSIVADHTVEEEERDEVPVVVQSDALINPHTVVVALLDTVTAHRAVLRPWWLLDVACRALLTLLKDYAIVLKPANGSELALPICTFRD